MVSVPDEVRCVVCRSIFCCLDCRNRHEQNSHCPNEVWTERNRLQCGLCQGFPALEFCNRNDFALIMHLCQFHLPLHCKKCLTQFNSIGDFSAANKCAHLNDVCSLQSPLQKTRHQHHHHHHSHAHSHSRSQSENHSTSSSKDVSDVNYITAVQKSSFERSMTDNSVISLRNYSTILHTSNHPLYKTQTPVVEKALVRQTSTPMHHNLAIADTAPASLQLQPQHTNGSSCSQCMGASTSSGQLSCINSSSDSDTSINTVTKSNDIRPNIQQQNIMMTKSKTSAVTAVVTTAFKRSRKSPNVTPLTRQVMTKSIHRAILEYQHTQSLNAISPKSPLDLRMQQAILRNRNRTPIKCLRKTEQQQQQQHQHSDKSLKINGSSYVTSTSVSSSSSTTTTVTTVVKNAQGNHSSRLPNTLETVYEQEKDANSETTEHIESNNSEISNDTLDEPPSSNNPIVETPILLSRRKCIDGTPNGGSETFDSDEWFTPKEFVQTNVVENNEIFTPKVSKKRIPVWRIGDDSQEQSSDTMNNHEHEDNSTSISSKLSGSKIWSFVSSILRFASLNSPNNLSMQEPSTTKDNESHAVIRRCASFAGFVGKKNVLESSDDDGDGDGTDPLQPIKRRRITSIDAKSIDRMALKYQKRIMCRPPIRRMLNHKLE